MAHIVSVQNPAHSNIVVPAAVLSGLPGPVGGIFNDSPADQLEKLFFANKSLATIRTYRDRLLSFAEWCQLPDMAHLFGMMVSLDQAKAFRLAEAYKGEQLERGLSAATVALSLSALRSLVKTGYKAGLCNYILMVDNPTQDDTKTRCTAGPGVDGVQLMMDEAAKCKTELQRCRNRLAIGLMFGNAFRRNEAITLDWNHVNLDENEPSVLIQAKGRRNRKRYTISLQTRALFVKYWEACGRPSGDVPVFVRLDSRRTDNSTRLSGSGLYFLIRTLSERATGKPNRPHGLRHTAITHLLTVAPAHEVQKLSRHRSLDLVMQYDDSTANTHGKLAAQLGAVLH